MNSFLRTICFFFISFQCYSQPEEVIRSLFMIGDCGESQTDQEPIWKVLREMIVEADKNGTVIFLGDNIYDRGMPDKDHVGRPHAEKILAMQAHVVKDTRATAVFIPGNHDWAHWGKNGYQYILNQQQWIDTLSNPRVMIQPRNACPGPMVMTISDRVVLIIIDTQWLLHRHDKPGKGSVCSAQSAEEVYSQIETVFKSHQGKRIILAAHHPLLTYGIHGGVLTLRSHLFPLTDLSKYLYIPLPGLGSLYAFYRKWRGSIQDTSHPKYRKMKTELLGILENNPGHVYVSGHEHALQYIVKNNTHHLGSGSGAKVEHVKKKGYAKLAEAVRGFIRLDVHADGSCTMRYFQVDHEYPEGREIYSERI